MSATTTAAEDAAPTRRTQRERREATVAKLIDAAIAALQDVGFARTTTREISARAGVSDGALFRHFQTRLDLIVGAAEKIAERVVADFLRQIQTAPPASQPLASAIGLIRESVRTPANRVWHELLAAARTDPELRRRLEPATRHYIRHVREAIAHVPGLEAIPAEEMELWLALLLHLFDGEAIFSVVAPNPEAEDRLLDYITQLALTHAAHTIPAG